MKGTTQTHFGNVPGSGHSFRGVVPVVDIPRHQPYPRQMRRFIRNSTRITLNVPKEALVTPLLRGLLWRFEMPQPYKQPDWVGADALRQAQNKRTLRHVKRRLHSLRAQPFECQLA